MSWSAVVAAALWCGLTVNAWELLRPPTTDKLRAKSWLFGLVSGVALALLYWLLVLLVMGVAE